MGQAVAGNQAVGNGVGVEGELEVGRGERGIGPLGGEAGAQHETAVQGIGLDTAESLHQQARGHADGVAEVAVALASGSIVEADLAQIAGALAEVHAVEQGALHQMVALAAASGLEVGQGGVHHLGKGDIVDAPRVGQPIGGGEGGIACGIDGLRLGRTLSHLHRDVGDGAVDVAGG